MPILKKPRGGSGGSILKIIATVVIVAITWATIGGIPGGLLISCQLGLICSNGGGSTGGGGGGGGTQSSSVGASCNSIPNACGQTNIGSAQACSSYSGTPPGACTGSDTGFCNASPPPNSNCPPPAISGTNGFYAKPSTLGPNGNTTLYWSAANATNCDITSDGGFSNSGTGSGSVQTPALTQTTTFTLTCRDGDGGPTAQKSLRVVIDPHYQEI